MLGDGFLKVPGGWEETGYYSVASQGGVVHQRMRINTFEKGGGHLVGCSFEQRNGRQAEETFTAASSASLLQVSPAYSFSSSPKKPFSYHGTLLHVTCSLSHQLAPLG